MPNTFATSVPGIGIRFFASNGTSGTPGYFNPANGGTYNGSWSQSGNGGVYYGIELVATGPVGTGTITPGASAVFTLGSLTISILQITSTQVVAQTCQINADSSVDLPKISASALPSNGSTAGRTSFTITLSNCPAQMRAIQYQLDAPGGVINAAAGTFLASGGSTVQGVGLIVTDASDNTFSLATMHTLNQYNPSTGGTYPIGFNLKYFRTGTVSPGTLKAQLTYTFSYQ